MAGRTIAVASWPEGGGTWTGASAFAGGFGETVAGFAGTLSWDDVAGLGAGGGLRLDEAGNRGGFGGDFCGEGGVGGD